MSLADKTCLPCQGFVKPFDKDAVNEWMGKIDTDWKQIEHKKIYRKVELKDFMAAVAMVNKIAELAEEQQHHPDLLIAGYKNLTITIYTHKIDGLWESDFILAAKIDKLIDGLKD